MVTDKQVRRLLLEANKQKTKTLAAAKAGMDEKTARKYLKSKKLPSQLKQPRTYRTRPDPFENIWSEIKPFLETNPGLEASTLFSYIQREQPGEIRKNHGFLIPAVIRLRRSETGSHFPV